MGQNISFDVIARDRASSTFSRISKSSDSTSRRLLNFGRSTAGLVGITSLTTAAVGFIKVGANYSSSLNKIQALSDVTDGRLKKVSDTLESQSGSYAKMGQTTGDAADGMVQLIKAGLGVNSALKAVSATMVLAKAGEIDVADASSLVANTLNTFHMRASRAGDIANYLANAANISSADVSDLAESLKYVAPVAAATGVSLEQTNAILAELSNSGIAASNAGTGFRKFLLSLQAPSGAAAKDLKDLGVEIFDASGKMKPLGSVIDILGGKLDKLTDEKRQRVMKDVFGLQGISSAQVILKNGAKGLETYTRGVTKAGAAQKLAEAGSKGFMGSLKTLRAEVISSAQAAYRDMEPALQSAAEKLTAFVEQMRSGRGPGGDFVSILKDLATVAKGVASFLGDLPGPVKRLAVEGLIAYAVMRKLSTATGGWGATLATTSAKTRQFAAEMTYSATRADALSRASQGAQAGIRNLAGAGGMLLLAQSASAPNKSVQTLMQTLGGAASGFAVGGPVGAAVGGLAGLMLGLATNTHRAGASAADSSALWKHYADTLDDVTAAQTKATAAAIQETIRSKHLNSTLDDYGFTNRQVVQAIQHQGPLRQRMITDLKAEQEGINRGYLALVKKNGYSAQETIEYGKSHKARADAIAQTLVELGAVDAATAKKREDIAATRTFTKAIKALPPKVETYVRTNGLKPGIAGVVELARQIKLTPTQIKLLLKENGAAATDAQVKKVQDRAIALGKLAPVVNVGATTGQARGELSSFARYLTEITRPRVVTVSVKHVGKAGGVGDLLGQTTGGGGGKGSGRFAGGSSAGRMLDTNMRAAATRTMTIKKALDKFGNSLSTVTDSLASLKDLRQSFLDTFQADNLFGADISGGGGAAALVDFEAKQAAQASQLLGDVQNLVSRGLSKALITQLQAQGTSGALQLHALATGSDGQIQQLNSLNAQTASSLSAAGMLAGNTVRGGNIDASIAATAREEAMLDRLVKKLEALQEAKYIAVEIESETIVRAIKKRNKRKGVATAGI